MLQHKDHIMQSDLIRLASAWPSVPGSQLHRECILLTPVFFHVDLQLRLQVARHPQPSCRMRFKDCTGRVIVRSHSQPVQYLKPIENTALCLDLAAKDLAVTLARAERCCWCSCLPMSHSIDKRFHELTPDRGFHGSIWVAGNLLISETHAGP